VFVIARSDEPTVVEEMDYLGMGAGPYYSFYRPYHLASIEAPLSIPPAVLDGISDIHPRAWRPRSPPAPSARSRPARPSTASAASASTA
jgi:predicted homoserine dehydrogenase-like protein